MTGSAVPAETAALPGGGAMPLLGFGTWRLRDSEAERATALALAAGYRHLDTATMYDNERQVGAAVRDSGLPRAEVFVTTKLPPDRAGRARETLEQSLRLLGLDWLDLWLVHWPPEGDLVHRVWREFVGAREQGLVRDIGVSNVDLALLDRLTDSTGVAPAVNQIPWSPTRFDGALLAGHRERGVVLEGYSGLKGGTLANPVITRIADRHGRTPAQVVIRWHLQHGVVVIPKSANPERIAGNADVAGFELPDADMTALDALGKP